MQNTQTFPITEAQRGLLVIDRSVPARNLYNIVLEVTLDPRFRPDEVRTALASVVRAQPALRLSLHETPSPHAELTPPPDPGGLPLRSFEVPAGEYASRRSDLLADLSGHVFALHEPPLFRAAHLRRDDASASALLLAVHHTVFDGFSAGPFARDLNTALSGGLADPQIRTAREQALRAELEAQLTEAADEDIESEVAELAARLRSTPATELYPRPGRPTRTDFTGERLELPLTTEESTAVDRTCRKLGITPFTFYSSVYAAVLARHSGNSSATLGATLMSRSTLGAFDLCGFFVNTMPLTVPVDWNTPFGEFAAKVVDDEVEDTKFRSHIPFNRIVEQCTPDRSSNRNPVFSALLAMQDSTAVEPGRPVTAIRQHGNGTAKFDLLLFATPTADSWVLELEYDPELLPRAVADGLATSLHGAVRSAAEDPGCPLAHLFKDAGSPAGSEQPAPEPPHTTVYEWVMATAAECPDRTAVVEDDGTVTYGRLARDVHRTARGLSRRGVGRESVVGVATEGLSATVTTVLAILELRAAYLPIDPRLPTERIDAMVEQADCRLVVSGAGTRVGFGDASVCAPEELTRGAEGTVTASPATAREPGDPVYTMFTSGSTGRPKGVLMSNGPLVNLTRWQLGVLGMDHSTRFLQYAPIGFDVSFQEIFPTLAAGGTLVSRDPVDRRDLPGLVRRAAESGVSHLYLPVAALRPFALAAEELGEELPALRRLCVAGEQLQADSGVQRFFERRPHIRLFNMYGPTETHVVTAQELSADTLPWPSHVPIGRPVPGVTAQVVDVTGHLAPAGTPGELLLGGRCPARGYINDPVRTAERFVEDPYSGDGSGEGAARRYRTGDRVFLDEHGVLVYAGRNDQQVKIRGHRVELGELESAALTVPGVHAAVAATRNEGAERELLLFVVPDEEAPAAPAAVRAALTSALPSYMVPSHVLPVDSVPASHNGKLDRAALLDRAPELLAAHAPDPAEQQDGGTGTPDGLDRSLVAELCGLWSELLGRTVPVEGSLVEHGAHSLNVLTALTQVEQRYGVQVTILEFFSDPTVRALAEAVAGEGQQA